jgi:hypothetical protein
MSSTDDKPEELAPPTYQDLYKTTSTTSNQDYRPVDRFNAPIEPIGLESVQTYPKLPGDEFKNSSQNNSSQNLSPSSPQNDITSPNNASNGVVSNAKGKDLDPSPEYSILDSESLKKEFQKQKIQIRNDHEQKAQTNSPDEIKIPKRKLKLKDFWYPIFTLFDQNSDPSQLVTSFVLLISFPYFFLTWLWFQIAHIASISPSNTPHSTLIPKFALVNIYNEQAEINHVLKKGDDMWNHSMYYVEKLNPSQKLTGLVSSNNDKKNPSSNGMSTFRSLLGFDSKPDRTLARLDCEDNNDRSCCCRGNSKNSSENNEAISKGGCCRSKRSQRRDISKFKLKHQGNERHANRIHEETKDFQIFGNFRPELFSDRSPTIDNSTDRKISNSITNDMIHIDNASSSSSSLSSHRPLQITSLTWDYQNEEKNDPEVSFFNPFQYLDGVSNKTQQRLSDEYYRENYSFTQSLPQINDNDDNDGNSSDVLLSKSTPFRDHNGKLTQSQLIHPRDIISMWKEDEDIYAFWIWEILRLSIVGYFVTIFQFEPVIITQMTIYITSFAWVIFTAQYLNRVRSVKRSTIMTIDHFISFPIGLYCNLVFFSWINDFISSYYIFQLLCGGVVILYIIRIIGAKPQRHVDYQHHVNVVTAYLKQQGQFQRREQVKNK